MAKVTSFQNADLEDLGPGKYFKASKDELAYSDFFWDRGVVISATVIIALSILDFSSAITRESVNCLTPNNFTRDQAAFVNSFCSEYTPSTDYFPIFLAGEGLVLGGLHFLWLILMFGRIQSFASVIDTLDRHKDREVGDYADRNYIKMTQLKNSFKSRYVYICYLIKLLGQIFLTYFSMVICAAEFNDFKPVFDCPRNLPDLDIDPDLWLLNATVPCVLEVLRSHFVAWSVNYVLVKTIFALSCFGLVKCLWTHSRELSYEESGEFCFKYGLPQEHSYFPKMIPFRWFSLNYRITNDFDFLLVRLYKRDIGQGGVLRELLVSQYVKDKINEVQEALTLLDATDAVDKNLIKKLKLPKGKESDDKDPEIFSHFLTNLMFCNEPRAPEDSPQNDNTMKSMAAFEACFGSQGFAYKLALATNWIISLRFDPFYKNEKVPVKYSTFTSGICVIRTYTNIYSQPTCVRSKVDEMYTQYVKHGPNKPPAREREEITSTNQNRIKFIMIGPFVNKDRVMTLHMLLYTIESSQLLDQKAHLIIVRPVKINGNDVSKLFYRFNPNLTRKTDTNDRDIARNTASEATRNNTILQNHFQINEFGSRFHKTHLFCSVYRYEPGSTLKWVVLQ